MDYSDIIKHENDWRRKREREREKERERERERGRDSGRERLKRTAELQ
jgi:hypothetical protein